MVGGVCEKGRMDFEVVGRGRWASVLLVLLMGTSCGRPIWGAGTSECEEPPANSCERFAERMALGDAQAGFMLDDLPGDAPCRADVEAARLRYRTSRRVSLAAVPLHRQCGDFGDAVGKHVRMFPEDAALADSWVCEPNLGFAPDAFADFIGDAESLASLRKLEKALARGGGEPATVESLERISGETVVLPSASAVAAARQAGWKRIATSIKLCVDRAGKVSAARVIRSSGLVCYDRAARERTLTWTYRPLRIDGQLAEVCSAVTFDFGL